MLIFSSHGEVLEKNNKMSHYFSSSSYHITKSQLIDKNITPPHTHTHTDKMSNPSMKQIKSSSVSVVFLHTALYKRKPRYVETSCAIDAYRVVQTLLIMALLALLTELRASCSSPTQLFIYASILITTISVANLLVL